MIEKVESGLGTDPQVTAEMHRIRGTVALVPPGGDREDLITYAKEVVGLRDALSERDAEIQRQRERHRATWTQLEQAQRENAALKKLLDRANERMDALKSGAPIAQTAPVPSAARQILDLIMEECRYWHGRDEARRGNFANLYAAAKELADNTAPISQTATVRVPVSVIEEAAHMLEAHSPGSGSVESFAAQDLRAALSVQGGDA